MNQQFDEIKQQINQKDQVIQELQQKIEQLYQVIGLQRDQMELLQKQLQNQQITYQNSLKEQEKRLSNQFEEMLNQKYYELDEKIQKSEKKFSESFSNPNFAIGAYSINLGLTEAHDIKLFTNQLRKLWNDLGNTDINTPADATVFIQNAALLFKQPEQPLSNAIEVIKAIITPQPDQTTVSFMQFAKLMAMFGPKETFMIKVSSLLICSNTGGQWLIFTKYNGSSQCYGYFSDEQLNCLELNQIGKPTIHVYNQPLVQANHSFVRNENEFFKNWEAYFAKYPFGSSI